MDLRLSSTEWLSSLAARAARADGDDAQLAALLREVRSTCARVVGGKAAQQQVAELLFTSVLLHARVLCVLAGTQEISVAEAADWVRCPDERGV